jgi:hypothetical protein
MFVRKVTAAWTILGDRYEGEMRCCAPGSSASVGCADGAAAVVVIVLMLLRFNYNGKVRL